MMLRCDQTHAVLPSVPLHVQGWAAGSSLVGTAEALLRMEALDPGLEPVEVVCWLLRWTAENIEGELWPRRWSASSLVFEAIPTSLFFAEPPRLPGAEFDREQARWTAVDGGLQDFVWWGEPRNGERTVWLHRADGGPSASLPEGFALPVDGMVFWLDVRVDEGWMQAWPSHGRVRALRVEPGPP